MQKVSDELKLQQIYQMLDKIDDDKDGHLKVDDVLKVEQTYFSICWLKELNLIDLCCALVWQIIEMIGKEDVDLSSKNIDEIIELITKEEYLENEEKIEKALAKSMVERQQQQKQPEMPAKEPVKSVEDDKHILHSMDTLANIAQDTKVYIN